MSCTLMAERKEVSRGTYVSNESSLSASQRDYEFVCRSTSLQVLAEFGSRWTWP